MDNKQISRRDAIKRISVLVGGTTTAVVLPTNWTKPLVESVVAPANAAGFVSYCSGGDFFYSQGKVEDASWCPQPTTAAPTTQPPTTLD